MPATEEVIELSIQETNQLRAKLGLAPLRVESTSQRPQQQQNNNNNNEGDEVLEMSVDDTNALRAKLGLPPLRAGGSSTRKIEDANLKEKEQQEEDQKIEAAIQLEDDVQRGIASTFTAQSLGASAADNVSAWAAKLRSAKPKSENSNDGGAKKKGSKKTKKSKKDAAGKYDEQDLKGINVSHAMSELEAGSTTVMTLADAPLLESNEHNPHIVKGLNRDADDPMLENVNLAEQSKQADGLRKKRQLELGMGRAGGYAGFDDDEFAELGGTGVPSRATRGSVDGAPDGDRKKATGGFKIGLDYDDKDRQSGDKSDLFAMEAGKAISLDPAQADVQASDFMTEQEDLELRGKKSKKKSKKDKFEKKKNKKEKKKHRRRQVLDDGDDEESDGGEKATAPAKGKTLLEELEETAQDKDKARKRSRAAEDEDGNVQMEEASPASVANNSKRNASKENKRAKYDAIMAKGNARTEQAFGGKQQTKTREDDGLEDEPDDAFLNAALAKARRLKKLRDLSGAKGSSSKGAEAVVESVQSMPDAAPSSSESATASGGITFSIDDTREFTRALQARSDQKIRKQNKVAARKEAPANTITTVSTKVKEEPTVETVKQEDDNSNDDAAGDADVDMAELAKEMKDDDGDYNKDSTLLDGTTGSTVAVGRGLAGVVNLFKQTGDLTRKNAGKEELRGRAKDERNYEDYEKLDLKSVVKIDNRHATEKDRDMASREVKLEYRDKHGRLLTRKEAYRDLCYQFHGHGSSKRNEEKRLKQMAREQAETRLASQQLGSDGGPGMLGALKATQKATGKAFVVHKT